MSEHSEASPVMGCRIETGGFRICHGGDCTGLQRWHCFFSPFLAGVTVDVVWNRSDRMHQALGSGAGIPPSGCGLYARTFPRTLFLCCVEWRR